MKYQISPYIIHQPLSEDDVLLYSTLSTSLVVLEKEVFEDIFLCQMFAKHQEICSQLSEMGFLYIGAKGQQADALERIRKSLMEADHGITAITITPTMECNARCYYCFEKGALSGAMTMETADRVVEFLIKNCTEKELYISWFGGEPLLAVDIIDYINERLLVAGIKVESNITTNGILINERIIEKLKRWNAVRVQITLDGLHEEYNRVKNYDFEIENPFKCILDNISLLVDNDINIHLRVNHKSEEYDTVGETISFLHNRFGRHKKLYIYGAPVELPEKRDDMAFNDKEQDVFLRVLQLSAEYGYENDELDFEKLKVSDTYHPVLGQFMLSPFPANCYMINKDRFVVDYAGRLYKCQKHLGKPQFSCGDVFNGVEKNEIYNHYVSEKLKDEKCKNCFMLPICQGGCNANRLLYGERFACPPTKSIAKQLVYLYYKKLMEEGGETHEDYI